MKEPILVVEKEIRSFRTACKEKYCALVLLAFLTDGLSINDLLENENSREKFKLALKLCRMQDSSAPYIIGDTLKTPQGFFVKMIGDTYHCYHDFVMEVTTLVFRTDYPTVAIKYADVSFFRKRVKLVVNNAKNDRFTIYLSDKHIADLGQRLFTDLLGVHFIHVVLDPCLKDTRMIRILIKEFEDQPGKLQLLLEKKKTPRGTRT